MADQFRFRYNQRQLQKYAVASATVIEIGDLLVRDGDEVIPAADFVGATDLATTQANASAAYVGVAVEGSAAGDTDDISVDVSQEAVYEMDAPSATYEVGDSVGIMGTGTTLESQRVVAAVAASSVGRVYEKTNGAATKVKVQFASAYKVGSGNTNAEVG